MVTQIRGIAVKVVTALGMVLIVWMAASQTAYWPGSLADIASPLNPLLVIVVGPTAMVLLGYFYVIAKKGTGVDSQT